MASPRSPASSSVPAASRTIAPAPSPNKMQELRSSQSTHRDKASAPITKHFLPCHGQGRQGKVRGVIIVPSCMTVGRRTIDPRIGGGHNSRQGKGGEKAACCHQSPENRRQGYRGVSKTWPTFQKLLKHTSPFLSTTAEEFLLYFQARCTHIGGGVLKRSTLKPYR